MKRYLPIFFAVLLFACTDKSAEETPYTTIKGKIIRTPPPKERKKIAGIDWDKIEESQRQIGLVTSAIRSGFDVPNHNGVLGKEGNFHFIIKLEEPTEIRINFGSQNVPIYATPGDEIEFVMDWVSTDNTKTVSGDNKEINEKIIEFDQLFRDSFRVELNATLPYAIPREFKTQRAKITKRIKRFTEDFIQKNAKDSPILANWVTQHADYRIAMDYMKYSFRTYGFSQYSPNLKAGIGEEYFDFLEEFPVNNPAAISNLNYQNYLQFYQKYLMARLRQTTPYQDCTNLPSCNEFEMEVAQLSKTLTGRTKDLVLSQRADYQLIRNNKSFMKNGFKTYLNEIGDSLIIKDLLARKELLYGERVFEFPDNASLIQTDANGKEILNDIIQQSPNTATLLYFWNTQREISWRVNNDAQTHDIWKQLDSMNIKLVLMAHHSTPNIWKDKVKEYGLIGDLWHLTDEQFSFFEDFFHNNRKPHVNYDKIYDRENFILLIDGNQSLNTIDDISFRESSFTWLNMLPNRFKYILERQKKAKITAGAQ